MTRNNLALITGASSGIGLAIANSLASSGLDLIITARREERLSAAANRLALEYGVKTLPLVMDVRDSDAVAKLLHELPEGFREVDILVNNAGLAVGMDPVHEGVIDDWERMIDTNLKGLMYVTQALLPGMISRNSGHIVNIASTAGHVVYPGGSVYCATKHAVKAITKSLMLELMDYDIRVSSIDPGMVRTEFSEVRFKGDNARADDVYKGMTPLSAEDVADAVLYVVSRPKHVMIGELVLYATAQGDGRSVSRRSK
jgi:3-hydroxy acid dehydrogenase/malonic semialdehyde reductase